MCPSLRSVQSLSQRFPVVSAVSIVEQFIPPPRFSHARLDNYIPDANEPSQVQAVEAVMKFAEPVQARRKWSIGSKTELAMAGIYLDGGYGVGKTHLLAGLFYEQLGRATFASFVEYTNLVGALGFAQTVELLSNYNLVCIDEFELDDPGDTVLISSLLHRLVDKGVRVAATSNTLPDRLGEGRFAADDFIREIQGLKEHFEILRIDGPDYRHRENLSAGDPLTYEAVAQAHQQTPLSTLDEASNLQEHLSKVHPSSYGAMVANVSRVFIQALSPITHQADALRWVVLIDRLYDRNVPITFSGCALTDIFTPEMLKGGYRKKYLRAISRLSALSRES